MPSCCDFRKTRNKKCDVWNGYCQKRRRGTVDSGKERKIQISNPGVEHGIYNEPRLGCTVLYGNSRPDHWEGLKTCLIFILRGLESPWGRLRPRNDYPDYIHLVWKPSKRELACGQEGCGLEGQGGSGKQGEFSLGFSRSSHTSCWAWRPCPQLVVEVPGKRRIFNS